MKSQEVAKLSRDLIDLGEKAALGGYHLFVGNTISTLLLAVNAIIIARLLGPDGYGVYSISLVVPTLFVGLVDFGVGSALIQFSAKLRAEGKDREAAIVIGTGLFFEFIVSTVASVLCFFLSDVTTKYIINRPELSFYLRAISVLILLQTISSMLASVFIGFERMEANSLMMIASSLVKVIVSPLLVIVGFGIFGALVAHVLYSVAMVTTGFMFMKKYKIEYLQLRIDYLTLKTIFKYSLPIYFANLIRFTFFTQYQTIILAFFATNVEVGNFQVITLFTTAMRIIIFPFDSLFPSFAKSRTNMEGLKRLFKRSVKYAALLIVPASLAISILSKDLIFAFYGSDYILAPRFLSIFILTHLFAGLGSTVFRILFSGIEKTGTVLKSNLIKLLIFFPLGLILTNLYGVIGLIFAVIASSSASIIYYLLVAAREFDIVPDLKSSIRIYAASMLAIIPPIVFLKFSIFNSALNLLVSGAIFCLSYLILLPVTKAINNNDLDIFTLILNKNRNLSILKPVILFESMIINRLT